MVSLQVRGASKTAVKRMVIVIVLGKKARGYADRNPTADVSLSMVVLDVLTTVNEGAFLSFERCSE